MALSSLKQYQLNMNQTTQGRMVVSKKLCKRRTLWHVDVCHEERHAGYSGVEHDATAETDAASCVVDTAYKVGLATPGSGKKKVRYESPKNETHKTKPVPGVLRLSAGRCSSADDPPSLIHSGAGGVMSCYHPLKAYEILGVKSPTGKKTIVFRLEATQGKPYAPLDLPCGQCIGCRTETARQWAVRCVHEASMYEPFNCFITLTYNDEHLPEGGSLTRGRNSDFSKFIRRLRREYKGEYYVEKPGGSVSKDIRYYQCGEYGDELQRPHHHALLFNFDFDDRVYFKTENGYNLYTSDKLDELWTDYYGEPMGFATVGDVTYETAAYVARYVHKKITGKRRWTHYQSSEYRVDNETGEIHGMLEPEHQTMSRRPGIGKGWISSFAGDIYPKDYTTINGKRLRPPRYYDAVFDISDPEAFRRVKEKRKEVNKSRNASNEYAGYRLRQKEKCHKSRIRALIRRLENDG